MDGKPIAWLASSYEDLIEMPGEVRGKIGYALYLAQCGKRASFAKQLHGDLASITEIVVTYDKRAFAGFTR
jgi:phage-related protein